MRLHMSPCLTRVTPCVRRVHGPQQFTCRQLAPSVLLYCLISSSCLWRQPDTKRMASPSPLEEDSTLGTCLVLPTTFGIRDGFQAWFDV